MKKLKELKEYCTWNRAHTVASIAVIVSLIFYVIVLASAPYALVHNRNLSISVTCGPAVLLVVIFFVIQSLFSMLRSRSLTLPIITSILSVLCGILFDIFLAFYPYAGDKLSFGLLILVLLAIAFGGIIGTWVGYAFGYYVLDAVKEYCLSKTDFMKEDSWISKHKFLAGCWFTLVIGYIASTVLVLLSDGIGIMISLMIFPFLLMAGVSVCAAMAGKGGWIVVLVGIIYDALLVCFAVPLHLLGLPCGSKNLAENVCFSIGSISLRFFYMDASYLLSAMLPTLVISVLGFAITRGILLLRKSRN